LAFEDFRPQERDIFSTMISRAASLNALIKAQALAADLIPAS
jgi:hypothetical protein